MTPPTVVHADQDSLKKYVGRYEVEPTNVWEVVLEDGSLWLKNIRPVKVRLLQTTNAKFFIDGREDLSVVFETNEKGAITGFKIGGLCSVRKLL